VAVATELFNAAVSAQLPLERPDFEGNRDGSGMQGYWKKPDGTITFGSYTVNGMRSYTIKGFMPLSQYGQFTTAFDARRRLDPMIDPYRHMLEQGGIKEVTQAQIVELGWHRKPHAVLARAMQRLMEQGYWESEALTTIMPQLKGFERRDVLCQTCPGRVFNSQDELERHEIIHREDVQTRRLGESISSALAGSAQANEPILKMLAEAIQMLSINVAEEREERKALSANVKALLNNTPAAQSTTDKVGGK